jgi:hypothetical protein
MPRQKSTWVLFAVLLYAVISVVRANSAQAEPTGKTELEKFFRESAELTDDQIKSIQSGNAIAKVMKSPPEQVFVFGVVFVKADPEAYLDFTSNMENLRKLPGYLAFQKFSDPPQISDLVNFNLEPDDIKDLQQCKADDCEVQLPAQNMREFQAKVNWKAADRDNQVNRLAQEMALRAVEAYIQGGNGSLGIYRDKKSPTLVAETFQALVSKAKSLPVYLPDLYHYLLEYPNFQSPDIRSELYWQKVKFGLKPTLRIIQSIIYTKSEISNPVYAIAEKQIYSSHYFQTALDVTVAVPTGAQGGFYLITAKGSQQAGLTGLKGGMVRKVAVDKSRSSLEKALTLIKQKLER